MRSLPVSLLTLAATLSACDAFQAGETVDPADFNLGYSDFASLPDEGWRYGDTVTFITPEAEGELRVAVRHSIKYPYRNIWLEVSRRGTDSAAIPVCDTVELELADPFGLWKGTGVGPTRQMETVVAPSVKVDSGSTISIRHIMRLDTLPAIEQTGIFIID